MGGSLSASVYFTRRPAIVELSVPPLRKAPTVPCAAVLPPFVGALAGMALRERVCDAMALRESGELGVGKMRAAPDRDQPLGGLKDVDIDAGDRHRTEFGASAAQRACVKPVDRRSHRRDHRRVRRAGAVAAERSTQTAHAAALAQ